MEYSRKLHFLIVVIMLCVIVMTPIAAQNTDSQGLATFSHSQIPPSEDAIALLYLTDRFIYAGYAGEDLPRIRIPSVVGRPFIDGSPTGDSEIVLYGNEALNATGGVELSRPYFNGRIQSQSDFYLLIDHVLNTSLAVPRGIPVAFIDSIPADEGNHESFFDAASAAMDTQAVGYFTEALAAIFGYAGWDGLPVVMDYESVRWALVDNGKVIPGSAGVFPIGERQILEDLMTRVQEKGADIDEAWAEAAMRDLLWDLGFVVTAADNRAAKGEGVYIPPTDITLPDGEVVTLQGEAVGSASLLVNGEENLAAAIRNSIEALGDPNGKDKYYSGIMISGYLANLPGLVDRFGEDLADLIADDGFGEPDIAASRHREFMPWYGGSLTAFMLGFDTEYWIIAQ